MVQLLTLDPDLVPANRITATIWQAFCDCLDVNLQGIEVPWCGFLR